MDSAVPAGTYAVTVTSTDTDGTTATCTLTVQVTTVLTVGEVQGQTLDSENGKTDRSPLAPATGNGSSSLLYDVRGVVTQKTLARTNSGGKPVRLLPAEPARRDRRRPAHLRRHLRLHGQLHHA